MSEPAGPGDYRTILYTPNQNYNGSDTFTYEVRDTGSPARSSAASVSVQVDAVNDAPAFAAATVTRAVAESAQEGDSVGSPVTATDIDDGDSLTYSLSGADASSFGVDSYSGQITVGAGATFEAGVRSTYEVTIEARDSGGESALVIVTINVTAGRVASSNRVTQGGGSGGGARGSGSGSGGGGGEVSTAVVIVANGWSPPDIGVAAALAARTPDSAVVYTSGDRLSVAAREVLVDYLPGTVIVVGGENAVSQATVGCDAARGGSGLAGTHQRLDTCRNGCECGPAHPGNR